MSALLVQLLFRGLSQHCGSAAAAPSCRPGALRSPWHAACSSVRRLLLPCCLQMREEGGAPPQLAPPQGQQAAAAQQPAAAHAAPPNGAPTHPAAQAVNAATACKGIPPL